MLAKAGDGNEAGKGLVGGLGLECGRALVRDSLDLVEAGADVGLVGPVGELEDGRVELTRKFGEAGVVGEPSLHDFLVAGGRGGKSETGNRKPEGSLELGLLIGAGCASGGASTNPSLALSLRGRGPESALLWFMVGL